MESPGLSLGLIGIIQLLAESTVVVRIVEFGKVTLIVEFGIPIPEI